jgi:hypothetical protein
MFEPPISFNIHVKLVSTRFINIVITLDIFQQYLQETFFQLGVGAMEIDEMYVRIRVQNLHIVR